MKWRIIDLKGRSLGSMEKQELTGIAGQDEFIQRLRSCAQKLASREPDRAEILTEAARIFAAYSTASDTVLMDFSRESLDVYRSGDVARSKGSSSTVIFEESVAPLVELLHDRFIDDLGIRVFDRRVLDAPSDLEDESISKALDELGMNQGFIIPMKVVRNFGAQNIQGLLLVKNITSARFADPSHLALLRMALDMLSLTADNMDLGDSLSRLRPTDQMTGLASRNKFMSALTQELARSEYLGRSFGVVQIDIDKARLFNSDHGYRYGDLIIKTVAEDLLEEARPIDLVCRWGGAEFIMLLPELSPSEAFELAERCRKRVAEHPIAPDDFRQEVFVSVSCGVVAYPEHGSTADLLYRNVDLALLQAKMDGRNRSVLWSDHLGH